ncbi:MAG: hypothetical protein COB37_03210 [Kordiimonadales bacterium]|nr:MAG: hypothetical protein COB37_03210 [Kordiimonadales bacterium]
MAGTENWDIGCSTDIVRNEFIIPFLAEEFNRNTPEQILDLGTGTAYIPRMLHALLAYKPFWTVIDLSRERINFSAEHAPADMKMDAQTISFESLLVRRQSFNAILIVFTLLEMQMNDLLCNRLYNSLNRAGCVYVALPDCLVDVFNAAKKDVTLIREYLTNSCKIQKIDKFTNLDYPFIAHRLGHVVGHMIKSGFHLVDMRSSEIDDSHTYLFVFKKVP